MRYFAMIDGERRGPFRLEELASAGVRPSTYVWCKGMPDWQKAEEVADICRYFRRHIFDVMHGGAVAADSESASRQIPAVGDEDPYATVPMRFRGFARNAGIPPEAFKGDETEGDITTPPMSTLFISLLMTLFCFPITGLVAIYYSFKARKTWDESESRIDTDAKDLYNSDERRRLRILAHDYSRKAKMWIGISFFLGIIVSALVGSHVI